MRSGFVSVVGRPNVGKSTLVNRMVGAKVSIVSDKPQTTRTQVRGVLNRADAQVVFVDTPGIHKPRTTMGERLNATAAAATSDVDVVCLVIDATAPIGKGGQVLKEVGQAVREQLREGAYLDLVVKVEPDWQRQPKSLDRLGY